VGRLRSSGAKKDERTNKRVHESGGTEKTGGARGEAGRPKLITCRSPKGKRKERRKQERETLKHNTKVHIARKRQKCNSSIKVTEDYSGEKEGWTSSGGSVFKDSRARQRRA